MSVGYAAASKGLLRATILDAVGELAAERAWRSVSLADVAARAGVSRQTLYNEFGSRSELAGAYVMREAERLVGAVEDGIRPHADDPRAALRAALGQFLRAAEAHPVLEAVAAGEEGSELLALVTSRGGPLLEAMTARLRTMFQELWPGLSDEDAGLVAEHLVRLAISHAVRPTAAPEEAALGVARVLGPFLDDLLAEVRS